jgi:tetratricopeptide (TPR) repeat protein
MQKVHFPVYSGGDGNRSLVQTLTLDLPPGTKSRDSVVIELRIDLNKMMCFRAFLARQPEKLLEVQLENPLATRALSPAQKRALTERKHIREKRLRNKLYHPSPDELIHLANLERRAGEPERGLEILQRLQTRLKRENQNLSADGYNIMALCYSGLGNVQRACEHHKLSTEFDPACAVYAANYGCMLVQTGKAEEAIPHLRRAVSLDTADGYPFTMLGDALRHLGQEDEAMAEFRQAKRAYDEALSADPRNTHQLSWAEAVCRRLGDYEEAAKYRSRHAQIERTNQLGVPLDQLIAGLDSGIIPQSELQQTSTS